MYLAEYTYCKNKTKDTTQACYNAKIHSNIFIYIVSFPLQ